MTVEKKILPVLNSTLGYDKTYKHYGSKMRNLKARYNCMQELIRFSSGFGWDPVSKKFTAPDNVCDDYEKAHPNRNEKIIITSVYFVRKFYLADCRFANRRKFFAPFRGTKYHLQEFAGQGRDPENPHELFNHRHAALRNVIERIFGVFKSRFLIFKSAPPFPFKIQAELVLACVAIYNFLRKYCRSDEFPPKIPGEITSGENMYANNAAEDSENAEEIAQTQD